MKYVFERAALEVISLRKFDELFFPYSFYLKKLLKSDTLIKMTLPIVNACFGCSR